MSGYFSVFVFEPVFVSVSASTSVSIPVVSLSLGHHVSAPDVDAYETGYSGSSNLPVAMTDRTISLPRQGQNEPR